MSYPDHEIEGGDRVVEAAEAALDGAIVNVEKVKHLLRTPENDYEEGVQEGLDMAMDVIRRMIQQVKEVTA